MQRKHLLCRIYHHLCFAARNVIAYDIIYVVAALGIVVCAMSAEAQHRPVHIPLSPKAPTMRLLDPRANATDYILQTWTQKDGLPQESAQAMCQTRDGYIWIGTYQGLVRFDGVRFVVFDKDNTPEIRDNSITALAEDSQRGALWIGTRNGVTRLTSGIFSVLTTRDGLPDNTTRALLKDRDGTTMWIGTNNGVSKYADGKISIFSLKNNLPRNAVSALLQDRNGRIIVGTRGDGVHILEKGIFSPLWASSKSEENSVTALLEDRAGALWIGTRGGGVQRLNEGGMTSITAQHGLSNNRVLSLVEDHTGTMWVGTEGGGADRVLFDSHANTTTAEKNFVITHFSTKEGLPNNDIRSLLSDREGALWIGTNHGVSRIRQGSITTLTPQNGLPNQYIHAILQDRTGTVWVGTENGLCCLKSGVLTVYTTANGLCNNVIMSLVQDAQGALWIGTRGGGLDRLRFDADGKVVFTHFSMSDGLTDNDIRSLLQTNDGAIYIATDFGVNRFAEGRITALRSSNGILFNHAARLFQDRDSTLWIATNGDGVKTWKDGISKHYSTNNGLSNDVVWDAYQDHDGVMWFATRGGINRLKNGSLTAFTTKNGMFNDIAFRLLEDASGYFWMPSMKGISRVARTDLNAFAEGKIKRIPCRVFGTEDGMKSADCNGGNPCAWTMKDGTIWFATTEGVAIVHPNRLLPNNLLPTVIIENVLADSTMLGLQTPTRLSEDTEKFEFRYTATSMLVPGRVRFKYMLEGYDRDWIDAGLRRIAYYTNLPRGRNYRFRVIASNEDGAWNQEGASVMFSIAPFFWQTWWFGLCSVIAAVGGLAAVVQRYRRRIARLQEQRLELLSHIEERKRSERKFRALFDTSPLGMILWEQNGTIVEVNPAFEAITRFPAETIASLNFRTFISDSLFSVIQYGLERRGTFGPVEHSLTRADGEKLSVIISGMVLGEEGEVTPITNGQRTEQRTEERVWSVMEDITERKRANDAMLRYQLNPHFMFNVLNSINALMSEHPRNAKRMIIQFSHLLRHTLDASSQLTIPLGDEIEAVEHYLAIEKLRFEERLDASVHAQPNTLGFNVPVFFAQPLVENAIKYGMESSDNVLRLLVDVSLECQGEQELQGEQETQGNQEGRQSQDNSQEWLRLVVRNSGRWIHSEEVTSDMEVETMAALVKQNSTGIGLDNLRKRLQQLYPEGHTMAITESDGMVSVIIRIATRELEKSSTL